MTSGEQAYMQESLQACFNNLIFDIDNLEQEISDAHGDHDPKATFALDKLQKALDLIEAAMGKLQ